MKLGTILGLILLSQTAYTEASDDTVPTPSITEPPVLEKRINAEYLQREKDKLNRKIKSAYGNVEESEEEEKEIQKRRPWLRTIYGSIPEIVTPTVYAGVTFNAKPPATTNGLEPWISLNKNGSPKTIQPQLKNGHIKNPSPTYDTWFAHPTTMYYSKEELKAHNMKDDEVFEHVEWVEEDPTYRSLSPLMRCTPDNYFMRGFNKDISLAPFCFPRDNQGLKLDQTYFISWFSKYFEDAKQVRVHLSAIKEGFKDIGLKKTKAATFLENGGKIDKASFHITEWTDNDAGFYPITIDPEILGPQEAERKVLLTLQPDTIDDEEFDLLSNGVVIRLVRTGRVHKGNNQDLELLEQKQKYKHLYTEVEEGLDYEKYFAIMGVPTAVCFIGLLMYLFVMCNKGSTDLGHLRKFRKRPNKNTTHRRIPFISKKSAYSPLPQHNNDIPMKDLNKAD